MARYYSPIIKEDFIEKIRIIMEDEEYPYNFPKKIEADLSKVNFSFENYSSFEDKTVLSYPQGYYDLGNELHTYFCYAGGDWEYPLCFVYYWDGATIRAYIPSDGNVWNKNQKCAYGSEESNVDDFDNEELAKQLSHEKIFNDIKSRIILKK